MFARLLITALCLLTVGASAVASDMKIGVDLEAVFNKSQFMKRTQQLQNVSRSRARSGAKRVAGSEEQVLYLPQNPEYREIGLQMELAEHKALMLQSYKREVAMAQAQATDAYEAIHQLMGEYAADQQIDFVMIKPNPDLNASDPQLMQLKMNSQNVFWTAPKFDITEAFIAWVDEKAAPSKPAVTPSSAGKSLLTKKSLKACRAALAERLSECERRGSAAGGEP